MKIEQKIVAALSQRGQTLAIAESATGGALANRITNIPGSSNVLMLGIIAYSNTSKITLLKVKETTIKKNGAVSENVAIEMAQGVRKIQNTHFGISITGIAGPGGGTPTKPVGLTFICLATNEETLCLKCQFSGNRIGIKNQTVKTALNLLLEFLTI